MTRTRTRMRKRMRTMNEVVTQQRGPLADSPAVLSVGSHRVG